MNGLPQGAFNLPPGCTQRDVDPPVYCDECGCVFYTQDEETTICKQCAKEMNHDD